MIIIQLNNTIYNINRDGAIIAVTTNQNPIVVYLFNFIDKGLKNQNIIKYFFF